MLDDFQVDTGQSAPIGLSKKGLWFNFSLYASHASQVILGLRYQGNIREIPLIQKGEYWHIAVSIPDIKGIDYAYKVAGLSDPQKGLFFDPCIWLQDPLALFPTSESLPWGNYRSDPWSKVQISEPFFVARHTKTENSLWRSHHIRNACPWIYKTSLFANSKSWHIFRTD